MAYWDVEELIESYPRKYGVNGEVRIYRVKRGTFRSIEVRVAWRDPATNGWKREACGLSLTPPEWDELLSEHHGALHSDFPK